MIATSLVAFAALAGCQVLLAVKVADWLSPASAGGHRPAKPGLGGNPVALA